MTRLAIVGIDGATYEIIRPMVAAGELPHIARLLREGASGDLESEKPPMTPPAWTSMFTGLNPGRHGVFHFIRRKLGTYDCALNDSRNYAGKDLMSLLGRRGWSVGALSVPMTYPPIPVPGGWMVSGIPMPLSGDTIAWPKGTVAELERVLGRPYRPDVDYGPYHGDVEGPTDDLEPYERLRAELFEIERDRLKLTEHYLRTQPTDLFFTVVSITDRCQHYFWKFQDRSHPGWSEEGARRFGETIRDAYRLADEFVGRVRAIVGDQVPVAIVSDHGFGPQFWDFHVNQWLEQEGFLVRRKVPYWTWGKRNLGDALCKLGLGGLARALGPIARLPLMRPKRKTRADARDVVWERTRAFGQLHGICVNLQGREPAGVVVGEDGYRRTVDEIVARLRALAGPDGAPAVDFTVVKEDYYRGPRTAEAPDVQYQMMGLSCIPKEDWGTTQLYVRRRNAPISGQHRFNGVFAMWAPGVAAGRVIEGMHIQDTTPTLLYGVREPVPQWMDGRIRGDLMREPWEPTWDHAPEPEAGTDVAAAFGDADAKAIEESLRGLGYLQ
jgi:predicted AlkP superfamily phosphohydrolase/phosphomutase